jgi:Ca2+-binding RTX toxin-like protein
MRAGVKMTLGATTLSIVAATAVAAGGTYNLRHLRVPRVAAPVALYLDGFTPIGDFDGDGQDDLALTLEPRRGKRVGPRTLAIVSRRGPARSTRLDLRHSSTIDLGHWEDAPVPSPAGDLNGDGIGDLLLARAGRVWIVLGARGTTRVELFGRATSTSRRVVRVTGLQPTHRFGSASDPAVAALGDVNGDGIDDFAAGSPGSSTRGGEKAGRVYLFHGSRRLHDLDATKQSHLDGPTAGTRVGETLAPLGDFDGDGHPDIAVGANRAWPPFKRDAVWITPAAGPSRSLGAEGDMKVVGVKTQFEGWLAAAGDVNADGLADLGVEGPLEHTFLIYGAAGGGRLDLRALGDRGVDFDAEGPPRAAGDVTGDGRPDMLLQDWLLPGSDTPLPHAVDRDELGARGWDLDWFLVPIGDTDADGHTDLVAGVGFGLPCWRRNGAVAFIHGTAEPPRPPPYGRSTKGPDHLTGTADGDQIYGAAGNDRLHGLGGADCITGGRDDIFEAYDTFRVPRPDKDRLYGGSGDDEIFGGVDDDLLMGGRGDDELYGGSGRDLLDGGPGDDLLIGYDNSDDHYYADRYEGGPGDDVIDSRDGHHNFVDCGPGHDKATLGYTDTAVYCEDVRGGPQRH